MIDSIRPVCCMLPQIWFAIQCDCRPDRSLPAYGAYVRYTEITISGGRIICSPYVCSMCGCTRSSGLLHKMLHCTSGLSRTSCTPQRTHPPPPPSWPYPTAEIRGSYPPLRASCQDLHRRPRPQPPSGGRRAPQHGAAQIRTGAGLWFYVVELNR